MLLERAPAYVPITPDIPEEYLEQIEHDNAVYEMIRDQIDAEREAISWRQEKGKRKR